MLTDNSSNQSTESQSQKESALIQEIIKSQDLPVGLSNEIDSAIEKETRPKAKESVKEEATEETQEEETAQEEQSEQTETSEDESTEDDDSELIPRSKVQKRIDELTRRSRQLEAELRNMKTQQETKSPEDEERKKLESMSPSELKTLKTQVRLAQIKNSADDSKLSQLMDLEDKIEDVMQTSPVRFANSQISKFNDAVMTTASELEDFESVKKDLFGYASNIYKSAPELQSSVTGQARAWNLAVEHYKALSKVSTGKSKINELEQKVNTLKKKTSLDSSIQKGNVKVSDEARLLKRARNGSVQDKMEFFKKSLNTDSFIPDEFRK